MRRPINIVDVLADPEEFRHSIYRQGVWRGIVLSLADTEKRGRIQVRIIGLHPENSEQELGVPDELCPWAEPASSFGGSANNGFLTLPKVGSTVWVAFEHGFTGKPVWLGAWYGGNEVPAEFAADPANVRMLRTPLGHDLIFDDRSASPSILLKTAGAHRLHMTNASSSPHIELSTEGGHSLTLDDTSGAELVKLETTAGHKIEMDDVALTLKLTSTLGHNIEIDDTANSITTTTADGTKKIEVLPTSVVITAGAATLTIDAASGAVTVSCVNLSLNASGSVQIGSGASLDGITLGAALATLFSTHQHSGVQPGLGDTGAVLPAYAMVPGTHYTTTSQVKYP